MIKPLFNPANEPWVILIGRFMVNMGAIEASTRILIEKINKNSTDPIFSSELDFRIGFIKKKYPRNEKDRHKSAMNTFEVTRKLAVFRNIVAHSPLSITKAADGTFKILGIMNMTPKDKNLLYEIISLEELTGRVNESANVGNKLLEMQNDF